MKKLWAVVRREYVQRVRSSMFIIATALGPLLLAGFIVVPALVLTIKTGGPTRLAVVDESGRVYERVREAITVEPASEGKSSGGEKSSEASGGAGSQARAIQTGAALKSSFEVERVALEGRSVDEVKRELSERVRKNSLDGYLFIPSDILERGAAEYYGRNVDDLITRGEIEDRLSRAIIEQRMVDANVEQNLLREKSQPVRLSTIKVSSSGEQRDSGHGPYLASVLGILIYITLTLYGNVILSAVVEEKETRIAEVLFSSVRPFTLLLGKMFGISLVALTQYAIWALAFLFFSAYGSAMLAARGLAVSVPQIPVSMLVYFFLFFLLGYFTYATLYLFVGSIVTTAQEGNQVSMPVIFLLVIAVYLVFPVIRGPNSSFSFWVSMIPFFSPITMLVRIITQTPPFWQIALSLLIGAATSVLLIWIAARIYRVGMLMYGKRATIPEVMRWLRYM